MTSAVKLNLAPAIVEKLALGEEKVPSSVEVEVATCLHELQQNHECGIQREASLLKIAGAFELPINGNVTEKVVGISFPYRQYVDIVQKIQPRLIGELEKKLGRFVIAYAKRRIMSSKNVRANGMKMLPRSRTLTAVQNSLLEDIVKPADIVGKRIRVRTDGTQIHKIYLDPKDRDLVESKLNAFSEAYKKLTTRVAVFSLNTV